MDNRKICTDLLAGIKPHCQKCELCSDQFISFEMCENHAKQWLKDNPENPLEKVPMWDDIDWMMDLGGTKCKPIYCMNGNVYCIDEYGNKFCGQGLKHIIETVEMDIPLDKVEAVKELLK